MRIQAGNELFSGINQNIASNASGKPTIVEFNVRISYGDLSKPPCFRYGQ